MADHQHPITLKAFTDPSGPPAWKTIPSWYLVARQDRAIPPATQRFMAQRAGAQTIEIDSSHAAPVSHPGAVADVIRTAADRLTAGRLDVPGSAAAARSPVEIRPSRLPWI